jgi:hypothetical protein
MMLVDILVGRKIFVKWAKYLKSCEIHFHRAPAIGSGAGERLKNLQLGFNNGDDTQSKSSPPDRASSTGLKNS